MAVSDSTAFRYQQSDSDVRLMLRVRDDDAIAFEELVVRYQDRLVRILEHLGPRRDMAEDLAQEVFLRVYRARKRYEPGSKFSTWLFTIAGNVANNAWRASGRRKEISDADTHQSSSSAANVSLSAEAPSGIMPTRQLEGRERAAMVRAAIESLGERQRMALLLNRFEGMSHEEIGQAMGLSSKAVKSLLSRARVSLRDLLSPYMDEGAKPEGTVDAERYEQEQDD